MKMEIKSWLYSILAMTPLALMGVVLANLMVADGANGLPHELGNSASGAKLVQIASGTAKQKADRERTEFCIKGQFLEALSKNSNRGGRFRWEHEGSVFADIEAELNAAIKHYNPQVKSQLEGYCNVNQTMDRAVAKRVCNEVWSQDLLFSFANTELRTTEEIFHNLVPDHKPMLICAGVHRPNSSYYDFTD